MSGRAWQFRVMKASFWRQDMNWLWTIDGHGQSVQISYRNRAELRRWLKAQSLIRRAVRRGEVRSNG